MAESPIQASEVARHTPGPWTYEYGEGFFGPRQSPRGKPVPVVTLDDNGACGDPDCCGSPTYHMSVREEDASLIAAAPDLLSALRFVLAFYEPGQTHLDTEAWKRAEAGARAAVAKAEGRA